MKTITFLTLCTLSVILVSCSTSEDQFKYVSPPPTQQNTNENNLNTGNQASKTSTNLSSEQNLNND